MADKGKAVPPGGVPLKTIKEQAIARYRALRWEIWLDFAGSTTLHGPIHLTATKGRTRIYYAVVVFLMVFMFFLHTAYLIRHYFSYPILTEIKYNNIDYVYPDLTICPNSPINIADLEGSETGRKLKTAYQEAKEFWLKQEDFFNASPNAQVKRTLTRKFFENSKSLEHSLYYRCFTLRVRPKPPVPAGPTHGIRLILHRGSKSTPVLLLNEEEPFLLQSTSDANAWKAKEGFFIAFHEADTFPSFPLQQLPNGLSVRFGTTTTVALTSTEILSVNLAGRSCVEQSEAPAIQLVRHDFMSRSNAEMTHGDDDKAQFAYTERACVAVLRQKLTYEKCKCFSEAYSIPYSMRNIGQTWCHDIETSTSKLIQIKQTLSCMKEVERLTDRQIYPNLPTTALDLCPANCSPIKRMECKATDKVVEMIQPSEPGDGVPGCPLRCGRRIHSIHSHFTSQLDQDISAENMITYFERIQLEGRNGTSDSFVKREDKQISASDLIYLDISPVSESISQIIEDQGYTLVQFFSELGGVSGLYVGITIYTFAEVADVIVRYFSIFLPYLLAKIRPARRAN
ncbi:unnamed protein product [Dibothriocephalus latus]|uniref:Uncharacterized protein n=1 Tax=Dibothriocephalus latus TaxID=60516 RepID=A0A3P6S4N2_DIBLA|nr:unnamed protein product [Dibothriocephalus latus]